MSTTNKALGRKQSLSGYGRKGDAESEKIANPLGILGIVHVTLDSSNPLGVGDGNVDA
jgi:hypothetical protein